MSPEELAKFNKDALLHKLQDEADKWEEVPVEDLFEDGELDNHQAMTKVWRNIDEGEYKLMRRKV